MNIQQMLQHPLLLKAVPILSTLFVGLLLAWVAARVVAWLVAKSGLEALAEKAGVAKLLYAIGVRRGLARFLGRLTWYCGLFFVLSALSELLGLPGIASATSALIAFAPRVLAAGAIVLAGILVGETLRGLIKNVTQRRDDVDSPNLISNVLYYAVLTLAIIMAIDQIGIKTDLVDSLVRIAFTILLLSIGLGFALGSRPMFQNFVARQYCQSLVRVGDEITVGEQKGIVVRYSRVAVVIRAADNKECIIPCRLLLEQCTPLDRNPSPTASDSTADR